MGKEKIKHGSNDKKLSLLPYSYCRLFFSFALRPLSCFQAQKSRPSADVCQDLTIYGRFSYAHHSKYCINLKHLCSTRRIVLPCTAIPYLTEKTSATFSARSGRDNFHWDRVALLRCNTSDQTVNVSAQE